MYQVEIRRSIFKYLLDLEKDPLVPLLNENEIDQGLRFSLLDNCEKVFRDFIFELNSEIMKIENILEG